MKLTCPGEASTATIQFDPRVLRIDTNDEVYLNRDMTTGSTEYDTISGKQYVKKIVFELPAETTKYVKFYKVEMSENYTYPGVNATSPIQVTI